MSPASVASVATTRPDRYAKQLAAHLGKRRPSTWDEESQRGGIQFDTGRCDLSVAGPTLQLSITLSDVPLAQREADLSHIENVVGQHLVRFGAKDELVVTWQRQ